MDLYKYIRGLLQDADIRPRKRLGQNFLVDVNVLDAIVEAASLSPEDLVLEIGAGVGTLTQRLALSSGRAIAVELDDGLFRILQSTCQNKPNISLIHADILNLDFSALMDVSPTQIKIVGNLPYYITTPILMKILDESLALPIRMVLVMVQKEVGARMVASPGTKDYGALSIAIAYRSEAEIMMHVPASSFYPKPEVDSSLVRLNMRSAPPVDVEDERLFFEIVRAAFQYRRKTLCNALLLAIHSGEIHLPVEHAASLFVDSALQSANLEPKRRGETLGIAEFAALTNAVCDIIKIR